jgi:hypothetical protein
VISVPWQCERKEREKRHENREGVGTGAVLSVGRIDTEEKEDRNWGSSEVIEVDAEEKGGGKRYTSRSRRMRCGQCCVRI